jgi:hypothetical protein
LGTLLIITIITGLFKNRRETIFLLVILGVVSIVITIVYLIFKGRKIYNDKRIATPLAYALSPLIGIPEKSVQDALSFSRNMLMAKSGEIGRLKLPPQFAANEAQRQSIEHLINSRLPIPTEFRWHTATKKRQYLSIIVSPRLPKMIKFSSMLKEIRSTSENEVVLGKTADGTIKKWDLKSDEPMMLCSANTRRGKTRLAMLITCQVLHKGGRAILVDPKQIGLDEFVSGHPNAIVFNDRKNVEGSMWKPILDFKELLDQRIEAFKHDRTITFERALLVLDEISMWANISKQYWDQHKSNKDKATPPIFYDLSECLWAGAQFNMNVLVFGQVLGHGVLGNAVEAFGTRLLGGYTKQAYMRLIGITPIPNSQRARGRFLMHDGDDYPVWIQTILGEIEEMRDYALEPFTSNKGVPQTHTINKVQSEIPDRTFVASGKVIELRKSE